MEEIVRLPDDPDTDVTLTFCDDCNPDWDFYNTFVPPASWLQVLGLPEGTPVIRGTFRGTAEEARAQGWYEMDYGHRCPVCVSTNHIEESDVDAHAELLRAMRAAQTQEINQLLKKRGGGG